MKNIISRLAPFVALFVFAALPCAVHSANAQTLPPNPTPDVGAAAGPAYSTAQVAPYGQPPAYPSNYPSTYPPAYPSAYAAPPEALTPPPGSPAPGVPNPSYGPTPPAAGAYVPAPVPMPAPDASIPLPSSSSDAAHWVVAAEALWLERSVGTSIQLGFSSYNPGVGGPPAVPPDQLFADDVYFPLAPGVRLQIGRSLTDDLAIEGSYFGLNQWSVGRTIYGDPDGDTIFAFTPWLQTSSLIGGFNNYLSYTYDSRIDNAEFNVRKMLDQTNPYRTFAWLWGFRYFHLSDKFTLTGSDLDTGDYENLEYQTNNNLVGMQAGLQWVRGWDRFQLSTEGKIGLFANFYTEKGNNLNSSGVASGNPAGFVPFSESNQGTDFSALFEFSLLGRYRMTQYLWLRFGYQIYGVTGLALAPRQLPSVNHNGSVVLDGPSLGIEASW